MTSFNYTGWWLERAEEDGGDAPERAPLDPERGVVGVVLAAEDEGMKREARAAGFEAVGQFHWWHHAREVVVAPEARPSFDEGSNA